MNKENLIEAILALETREELNDIVRAVKSARKALKTKEIAMVRHLFHIGQRVNVVEKTKTSQGEIKKINRTRCQVVIDGDFRTWNVPMSMLEVVEDKA
mgnify:CR=1 FL=1